MAMPIHLIKVLLAEYFVQLSRKQLLLNLLRFEVLQDFFATRVFTMKLTQFSLECFREFIGLKGCYHTMLLTANIHVHQEDVLDFECVLNPISLPRTERSMLERQGNVHVWTWRNLAQSVIVVDIN